MSDFQTLILAVGGLQGFLLFVLLISDKRVNYASKLLGLLCLFIATTFALPIIVAAGDSGFAWLIGFLLFLPASYGPLTYLYCRTAITGSALRPVDALHLLSLLACYVLNYDLLVSADNALSFVRQADTVLFKHTLTKVIFYGQALFYAVLLMRMLGRYQTKAKQTLSAYNPDIFKWLWSIVAFMVSIWGLKILSYFFGLPSIVKNLADLLLALLVYCIVIVQWRNPRLFQIQKLESQPEERPSANGESQSDGLLDQQTRSSILDLVQSQVREKALYRDSELTLTSLADKVGVSVHQLSETLNRQGGKNFNQFINEYRVVEVCQELARNSDRKLIDLALDAGFSSKSSFNAIFKKLTGQTPSQYRKQSLSH